MLCSAALHHFVAPAAVHKCSNFSVSSPTPICLIVAILMSVGWSYFFPITKVISLHSKNIQKIQKSKTHLLGLYFCLYPRGNDNHIFLRVCQENSTQIHLCHESF